MCLAGRMVSFSHSFAEKVVGREDAVLLWIRWLEDKIGAPVLG